MPVSLIAAVAANLVIGNAGRLPWRLPDDLARFKRLTLGHPVVMGRKTFESLGKPLVRRRNIVLSRDRGLSLPGCDVARSTEEALALAGAEQELFAIGGASVYELFLPLAGRMYLTHVEGSWKGDAFFPAVRWEEWRIVSEQQGLSGAPGTPAHRFVDYERRGG
jgi:dihydrofolate reductase